ncbi:hypothetical protein ACLB1O_29500 [Escherichia coli]
MKIDTVRTDLPDSSPVCLNGMNIYESLSERHPGLFAKNQNVIFRSAFFDDGQAISSETIRKIMQSTPCVESQTTSAGSWEPATELIPVRQYPVTLHWLKKIGLLASQCG